MSDLAAPGGHLPEAPAPGLAWARVADDIAARISSGELAAGTRLRAERELAVHYGRSYGTVRRAMESLRERGLVVTVHGCGTYVRGLR